MENSKFIEVGLLYQKTLENCVPHYPSGSCYLAGYCLAEYFKKIGFESKSVSGSLELIDKNEKHIVYGNLKIPKSYNVGYYHTWCEIFINDEWYILDPSLKYNKVTLTKTNRFILNSKIPDLLFTNDKTTYFWKYIPNENLVKNSNYFLKKASNQLKNIIIQSLINSSIF